jgi:hypothetical protein
MENLRTLDPSILFDHLGVPPFLLRDARVNDQPEYDAFKASGSVPQHLIDIAYGSRLARHFYSDDELSRFAARWT